MIYQALLWRALFFVDAHLDSRVGYGEKWASNMLERVSVTVQWKLTTCLQLNLSQKNTNAYMLS